MKTLFYLKDGKYIDLFLSDQKYREFLSSINYDGYCFLYTSSLPKRWLLDRDIKFLTDGYSGTYSSNGLDGVNIFAYVENLSAEKATVYSYIDGLTSSIIASGFNYSGKTFSLSQNAQLKWSALFLSKDLQSYPVIVQNIDDSDGYLIDSAEVVTEMYMIGSSVVRNALDYANTKKSLVKQVSSKQELIDVASSIFDSATLAKLNKEIE